MRISLSKAVLAGSCAALAALGGVTALTIASIQHISADAVAVSKARETSEELNRLWRLVAELDSSARACLLESEAPAPGLRLYDSVKQEIYVSITSLRQMIDGAAQKQRLESLAPVVYERIVGYDQALGVANDSTAQARERFLAGLPNRDSNSGQAKDLALDIATYAMLRGRIAEMVSEQRTEILARTRRATVRWLVTMMEIVLTCFLAMLAVAGAGYLSRREIRERDRAEKKERAARNLLDRIMDGCGAAVYAKDRQGRILMVNRYAAALFGREPRDVVGRTSTELVPHEMAAVWDENNRRVLESGQPMEFEEKLIQDGRQRVFLSVEYPLLDESGVAYGLCGVSSDITSRKEAETALQAAKQAAEQASHFKSQFLSTVSHELRTPLSAIVGFSDLLSDSRTGILSNRQKEYVEQVKQSARHLFHLINEFLDLSKIEAGHLDLAMEAVRLEAVVPEVLDSLKPLADKKSLRVSYAGRSGVVVRADRTRLRQVLTNLVGNAVKFTPAGGGIQVSAREDAGRVKIEVLDTGPGIAKEEQALVFESFYQAKNSVRRDGSGLGLAISKRLIEAQGGDFGLESELGHGSRFYFTLPHYHEVEATHA
jgi:PAS domain S-box-containing protein